MGARFPLHQTPKIGSNSSLGVVLGNLRLPRLFVHERSHLDLTAEDHSFGHFRRNHVDQALEISANFSARFDCFVQGYAHANE